MIKFAYNLSFLLLPPKLILLFYISFDNIFKIIKLLYDILKIGTNYQFAIYHLYYKEKPRIKESTYNFYILYSNELISNPTQISICTTSYFCFRYSLSHLENFSITFFLLVMAGPMLLNQAQSLKRENRYKLSYILFFTFSKLRLFCFAQSSLKYML